ncbi:MAG: hemerythrin domain-containing protein [Kutzneria sp.]|nr:hemerythrin domain-containing protein [Kutzneria sp.]
MDAISFLRADHHEVLEMLSDLEDRTGSAARLSTTDRAARGELVTKLVIAESGHEAVEEQYFWPAVRRVLPDGDMLADRAIEQEKAAKQLLDKLDKTEPDDPEFEGLVDQFIEDARAHIAYEQDQVWPKMLTALNADQLAELGEKMEQAKKVAPTRPHPHTPANPAVLKTAGPAVAAADRIRDAATGRGQ